MGTHHHFQRERSGISRHQQSMQGGRGGELKKNLLPMRGDHLKMFQSHMGRSGKFY